MEVNMDDRHDGLRCLFVQLERKLVRAPGIAIRSKRTLLGAPGIATRSEGRYYKSQGFLRSPWSALVLPCRGEGLMHRGVAHAVLVIWMRFGLQQQPAKAKRRRVEKKLRFSTSRKG